MPREIGSGHYCGRLALWALRPSARTEKRMIVPERVSTNGPLTAQREQHAVSPQDEVLLSQGPILVQGSQA